MAPVTLRRTLLSLALSSGTLAAHAQTVTLTDAGFASQRQAFTGDLEFTGSYRGSQALQAIYLQGANVPGKLTLASHIDNTGDLATGATLGEWFQPPQWSPTQVQGDLVNQGSITVSGRGAVALRLDPVKVTGNLINSGLLSASGEPLDDGNGHHVARALHFDGDSEVAGDLINTASGRILASGSEARGITLAGQSLGGRLVNQGLVQAQGVGAIAVEAPVTPGANPYHVELAGIDNQGRIIALGDNAKGIVLDGATLVGSLGQHLVNSGTIEGQGTAIMIGQVGFDGPGLQPWYKAHGDLNLFNSGAILSEHTAIDASQANRPVELILRKGSQIVGDLIGIANIEVEGDTSFTSHAGKDATIRLRPDGFVEVGSLTDNLATTLTLGAPHTLIDGSLYVAGNSGLALSLGNDTNPARPVLKVSGAAEFGKGAQLQLAARGDDFRAGGNRYTLVEAGSLKLLDADGEHIDPNGTLRVTSSSALLKVDSSVIEGNRVVAVVTTQDSQGIDRIIDPQGGSTGQKRALGALLADGVLGKLADSDPLLQAATHGDSAQIARLAEQLTPNVNGGATQAATQSQSLVNNVTTGRTSALRGASSGDGFSQAGVWVQSLYSDATQGRRDGIAGYNAYSHGIAVGADAKLDEQTTLGLAYSFIDTDVNGKSGNKTSVQSHAFTLYGGYELGNYFVDASLTYGLNDNQGKREIAGSRAKADYDSDLLGLNLVGGYTWRISPGLLLEPRLAARYSRVDIDGYREKDASAALKVDDQRYEAIELGAGVRVAGSHALGAGTLEPQAKLMAYHDFAADQAQSTSTFLLGSTPFVTQGATAARNSYEAGVGADYKLGAVTLGVNYDYIGKSGFDADVFSAKVRYDF
ncbi:autotransporter domain-containing protein [Pseudomonas entomophila]|uniref:autotransporter family protein n=1 Tax=Pseudomonas entomophila TaxID=312306 RepID=UPI0023D82E8B|nr:autotransporter outer membrane beta-barrel domain-containing protein [Pseudomonas entomophila]MDF0731936.1 autotransporter domain-containing protein [Pseudomonas entomophila]